MSTELKRREKFTSRLEAVGVLHQDATVLADLTLKWVEHSGEEWTVKRFKALKLEFITSVVAKDCVVRRAPWISRASDGSISGPLRRFWVDPHYVAHPQIVLNAFQLYSSFVASSATESQTTKFLDSARAEPVALPNDLIHFIRRLDWTGVERKIALSVSPYWEYYRSPIKRVPSLRGTAPEDDISSDLSFSSNSSVVRWMYRFHSQTLELVMPSERLDAWKLNGADHNFVGTVSYIQEAGYKLRAVANPTRIVQHALAPLKNALGEVLKGFPEDCTFDQDSGVLWCQSQLQKGKKLSSIDLSDATNLFPFEIQKLVLDSIARFLSGNERKAFLQLCSIFQSASKAHWRLPDGTPLLFSKGQPLGLGPSFFLFALSHHVILQFLKGTGEYVILGDDIVISDPKLAVKYRELMEKIGCRISEEKSIQSQQLAEFASRLIRPRDVLRQWKWREITRSNVIDICRNMGPKFRTQVKRPMANVIDALAPIPKELGGFGWNAKGVPLSSRIDTSVAQHIIYSLKEEWVVLRRWRSCAISDFLSAHISFRALNPEVDNLHPLLDKDPLVSLRIASALLGDDSWEKEFIDIQIAELSRMSRPGPNLGETILWPMTVEKPPGYIMWGPPNDPWRTDKTAGLYRVIARILRSENRAMLS